MKLEFIRGILIGIAASVAVWFDSTITFLFALILGFLFNIIAGFRADEVKVKLQRLIPPIVISNFNGNKFKDSLWELFLVTSITYLLKGLIDLMKYQEQSAYVVQFLLAIAVYFYFRNGLRNLHKVYPKVKFISMIYHIIAFEFRKLIGNDLADIVDKIDKEDQNNHKK